MRRMIANGAGYLGQRTVSGTSPPTPLQMEREVCCVDEKMPFGWARVHAGGKLMKSQHAIINNMEVGDIRFYKERWKAVEEIERQELRASTVQSNWRRLNAIMRRANRLGLRRGDDDGEMEIFYRWERIRKYYGYESA